MTIYHCLIALSSRAIGQYLHSETSEYRAATGLKKICPLLRGVRYWDVV